MLQGIGLESQYKNDEQIDNQLRSVLFQIPVPGNPECLDGPELPDCFTGVVDLGAIDIERGRDHGMPSYNQLRQAFGLRAEDLVHRDHRRGDRPVPGRPAADPGNEINDPDSLDFAAAARHRRRGRSGSTRTPSRHAAVTGMRRTTARRPAAGRSTAT